MRVSLASVNIKQEAKGNKTTEHVLYDAILEVRVVFHLVFILPYLCIVCALVVTMPSA